MRFCDERRCSIQDSPMTNDSDSDIPNPSMERKSTKIVPLSAASLHILLALAVMNYTDTESARSGRAVPMVNKTRPEEPLRQLQNAVAAGRVEESRRQPEGEDRRRRYYRITGLGRALAEGNFEIRRSLAEDEGSSTREQERTYVRLSAREAGIPSAQRQIMSIEKGPLNGKCKGLRKPVLVRMHPASVGTIWRRDDVDI